MSLESKEGIGFVSIKPIGLLKVQPKYQYFTLDIQTFTLFKTKSVSRVR